MGLCFRVAVVVDSIYSFSYKRKKCIIIIICCLVLLHTHSTPRYSL